MKTGAKEEEEKLEREEGDEPTSIRGGGFH
jgi:hypothetical protein